MTDRLDVPMRPRGHYFLMTEPSAVLDALRAVDQPVSLALQNGRLTLAAGGPIQVPSCPLENLGDSTFRADHRLRYAYVTGAMANGIGSADIVEAMSRAGMVGFFGAAGLPPQRVEAAIDHIQKELGDAPAGFNLIHSPTEPALENAVVDLYLRRGVRLVEASAFLDLTLPVIRYRLHGIHSDPAGRVITPNRVIVKVSRVEVAAKFLAPAPTRYLQELIRQGHLTAEQARLAERVPVAQDLTAEADSGGHTDNRPLVTLVPTMLALRDRQQAQHRFEQPLRVGAAGGVATPASVAGAFAMGASYVLTGSVNQACVESGSSDLVREMLAQAEQADTAMAPAADMFEMGVKVQVLKRGTMFAMRAAKLYELYRTCPSLDALPAAERSALEKNLFRSSIDEIWAQTVSYFQQRDPAQIQRAERDPKHRMALVFRWYLGMSSRWANAGEPTRKVDYQVWCGPAMGAFNEWARGSFLEQPKQRRVTTVALNLLYGAAVLLRLQMLRCQGVAVDPAWMRVEPLEVEELQRRIGNG
jgi:PfaD family protein